MIRQRGISIGRRIRSHRWWMEAEAGAGEITSAASQMKRHGSQPLGLDLQRDTVTWLHPWCSVTYVLRSRDVHPLAITTPHLPIQIYRSSITHLNLTWTHIYVALEYFCRKRDTREVFRLREGVSGWYLVVYMPSSYSTALFSLSGRRRPSLRGRYSRQHLLEAWGQHRGRYAFLKNPFIIQFILWLNQSINHRPHFHSLLLSFQLDRELSNQSSITVPRILPSSFGPMRLWFDTKWQTQTVIRIESLVGSWGGLQLLQ